MILFWMLYKVKAFVLIFVNLFRRALCCLRKRRHSYCESVPLTHVVSDVNTQNDLENWSDWSNDKVNDKPTTVQDYIELYRQKSVKVRTPEGVQENPEEQLNFFEDMTPKITAQTKVLITSKNHNRNSKSSSRLNFNDDTMHVITSAELEEWQETNGWEGEQLLDQDAQKVLRMQKRLERERRAWEQQQKRLEKSSKSLGSKLAT